MCVRFLHVQIHVLRLMPKDCVQKYRSHVCHKVLQVALKPHTLPSLNFSHFVKELHAIFLHSWHEVDLDSQANHTSYKICDPKDEWNKKQDMGKGWGFSLKTKSWSSNHLLDLSPLISIAKVSWSWLELDGKVCHGWLVGKNEGITKSPLYSSTCGSSHFIVANMFPNAVNSSSWICSPVGAKLGNRQHK